MFIEVRIDSQPVAQHAETIAERRLCRDDARMGFFKRLLGRQSGPGNGNETRSLRLSYEPTPANLPVLAALVVEKARSVDGATLDYTPESLKEVDRILLQFREERVAPGVIAETIFCFGCYVGEVMRRTLGATWALPPLHVPLGPFPLILIGSDNYSSPILKAFKCVQNGQEDSICSFYHAMSHDVPGASG